MEINEQLIFFSQFLVHFSLSAIEVLVLLIGAYVGLMFLFKNIKVSYFSTFRRWKTHFLQYWSSFLLVMGILIILPLFTVTMFATAPYYVLGFYGLALIVLKDPFENFILGFACQFKPSIQIGRRIHWNQLTGMILQKNLCTLSVVADSNQIFRVPYKEVLLAAVQLDNIGLHAFPVQVMVPQEIFKGTPIKSLHYLAQISPYRLINHPIEVTETNKEVSVRFWTWSPEMVVEAQKLLINCLNERAVTTP